MYGDSKTVTAGKCYLALDRVEGTGEHEEWTPEKEGERKGTWCKVPKSSLQGRGFRKSTNNTAPEDNKNYHPEKGTASLKLLRLYRSWKHELLAGGPGLRGVPCATAQVWNLRWVSPDGGHLLTLVQKTFSSFPTCRCASDYYFLSIKSLFTYEPETISKRVTFHFYYKKTTSFKGK